MSDAMDDGRLDHGGHWRQVATWPSHVVLPVIPINEEESPWLNNA